VDYNGLFLYIDLGYPRSYHGLTIQWPFPLHKCRNPSFGLATKARGYKVAGQEGDPGVTSHAHGSAKSVRE
jgi:hypothetical protein